MISKADLHHHLRREREERALAEASTGIEARRSHLDLAESHARRAENAKKSLQRERRELAAETPRTRQIG